MLVRAGTCAHEYTHGLRWRGGELRNGKAGQRSQHSMSQVIFPFLKWNPPIATIQPCPVQHLRAFRHVTLRVFH
jgi:hypothetical protein